MQEETVEQKIPNEASVKEEFEKPKGAVVVKDKEKKTEDKVVIHTMPKRFYSVNAGSDKSKNVGMIIMAVGILFLIAVAAFLYFFLLKPSESSEPAIVETKQGTGAEKPETKIEKEPEEELVEPEKEEVIKVVEIEKEVKEEEEEIPVEPIPEETEEATSTPEVEPVKEVTEAKDTDKDGISDLEEEVLGTIANLKDSDGDGYDDRSELLGLYNPAGEGSIIINPGIEKFTNNANNYSLYYANKMTVEKVGGSDDSIMFEFVNGEMIQMIVEENAEKLSVEEWYKKQFDIASIKNDQRVVKKGWTGVWSEDRMVIFLAHPSNNRIYSLAYSVGEKYTLSYKNIFELMINSLELK